MDRIKNAWNSIVIIFFMIFIIGLAGISFLYAAEISFKTYYEEPTLVVNNPVMLLVGVLILFAVFVMAERLFEKTNWQFKYILLAFVILSHLILSILWIRYNTFPILADQRHVWNAAVALEQGRQIDDAWYFINYPFQYGMVSAMRLSIKIVGTYDPIAWRIFNVFFVIVADIGMFLISGEVFCKKKDAYMCIVCLMLLIFLPVIPYTSFVYGTTVSIAMTIWALFGTIKLIKSRKIWWGLLAALFLSIANKVYSGTYIATIAVVITVLINIDFNEKKDLLNKIVTIVAVALFGVVFTMTTNYLFYKETGITPTKSNDPAALYVLVGISVEKGVAGPGSFAGIDLTKYAGEEDLDAAIIRDCIKVLGEYAKGERNIRFFAEKTMYQWLDPYFSSLTLTINPFGRYDISPQFDSFLRSNVLQCLYQYLLKPFVAFVYIMSAVGVIFILKSRYKNIVLEILILYFVGGFTFQLFWESKSRYCMPYFMCLIPVAIYGVINASSMLKNAHINTNNKVVKSILILQLVITFVVFLLDLNKSYDVIQVTEFYSYFSGDVLMYVDKSYDDEKRILNSDIITVDKGMYDIDIYHQTDLSSSAMYGMKAFAKSADGNPIFFTGPRYNLLGEEGHQSFQLYVPQNNSKIQLEMFLDGNDTLVVPKDKVGYALIDHAEISRNNKMSTLIGFERLLTIMFFIDAMVYVLFHKFNCDSDC